MKETIITSGRMNPGIDPVLHAWGWEIPIYLFLGGVVAGILFFSAFYFIRGKSEQYRTTVKIAPIFVPIMLAVGLLALFLDLTHKLYFWRLYTIIRWESPMSWGAWILMIVFPLSLIWVATFIKDIFPKWDWKLPLVEKVVDRFKGYQRWIAWGLLITSLILGMYTGILLSAFNARPFWNTAILGPLFLVSGLSTGTAFVMLISKSHEEKAKMGQIDLILIATEIFLIIHMFMGFLASTEVQIHAAHMFLGGSYTAVFWTFVFVLGLIVPFISEALELGGYNVPVAVPAALVLIGGLILRFIVVDAGQASRWLYKFVEQLQ